MEYSRITEGAFDITYASVGYMYDFRARTRPSEQQIQAALPASITGICCSIAAAARCASRSPACASIWAALPRAMRSIAASRSCKARGFTHALVNAGGDSRVIGDRFGKPGSSAFGIPIIPIRSSRAYRCRHGHSRPPATTSATSMRRRALPPHHRSAHGSFGQQGAQCDRHCADRHAYRWPVQDGVRARPEEALRIYNGLPDVDAVLVTPDGRVLYSKGLEPAAPAKRASP
jgi:thiamine biosynthesis lipoprotein